MVCEPHFFLFMFLLSYNIKKLKILIAELPELPEGQIQSYVIKSAP